MRMNSNRNVLRPTQNRLALQEICKENSHLPSKVKYASEDQENVYPPRLTRPILTATRSIKKVLPSNEDETKKSREQLEEELFVLPEYRPNIFEHLKSVEPIYAPKVNFMELQSDINSAMRTILIDWLIEVADEYKLNDETLFLSVQYIDRFLSTVNVTRSKLQLLGTTCLYIAAKYEEMYPPALDEFAFITDNTYETKHILRMEQIVMKMLNFTLSAPTCYTFLHYFLTFYKTYPTKKSDEDDHQCLVELSDYLSTLTLLHDRPFSSFRSSMIAASCLYYAKQLLNGQSQWTHRDVQISSYTELELQPIVSALHQCYTKMFHQTETHSSLLRRYFKNKSHQRVKALIHQSKVGKENDDEDQMFEFNFDDIDDENAMSCNESS